MSVNASVNFTCNGVGQFVSFRINEKPANLFLKKGFEQQSGVSFININGTILIERYLYLREATIDLNNTNISCRIEVTAPFDYEESEAALLLIQGMNDNYFYIDNLCLYLRTTCCSK